MADRKPRKPIAEIIEELKSWLPNYDYGKDSYPHILLRMLASLPGGEEAEDMGYEPFRGIGWHEADQLGRVLVAIQDKRDVEDIAHALFAADDEEEEDVREHSVHDGRRVITTTTDIRTWIDDVRADVRSEYGDWGVDQAVEAIRTDDHPAWGTDWSSYLDSKHTESLVNASMTRARKSSPVRPGPKPPPPFQRATKRRR